MKRTSALILTASLLLSGRLLFATDCNRNGVDDASDLEVNVSEDCDQDGIPDECELVPIDFGRGVDVEVARIPRVVVARDFNGDGLTDLATGNQDNDQFQTSTVSIVANIGAGALAAAVSFDAGRSLVSMSAADLDGDGDVDLATANVDTLQVLDNRGEGSISFSAPVAIAARRGTRFVTASDVTGDGLPDLIATSRTSDLVAVLENQGSLEFADPVFYSVGAQPASVATVDFDGDGTVDLAVANGESGDISLLLTRGDGTLSQEIRHDAGARSPHSVEPGDLDGDGDQDLVVATAEGLSMLLNDGRGDFDTPRLHSIGPPLSLTVGDLDGDGDVDVASPIGGSDTVSVFVNDGTGRFFSAVFDAEGLGTQSAIATGDLDGDGDQEIAVTIINPDRVAVLFNYEGQPGVFRPSLTFMVGVEPHTADLGDLDGDGDLDVMTGNNHDRRVSLLRNDGDGRFAAPVHFIPGLVSFTIVMADLDGDGDLDVASADRESDVLSLLRNTGGGNLQRVGVWTVGSGVFHISAGDLDGDEDLELITANSSANTVSPLFNSGDGSFKVGRHIGVGTGPRSTTAADLDGDGDNDIAVANSSSSDVSVLVNDGTGDFEILSFSVSGGANFVIAEDLDLDGSLDLASVSEGNRSVSLLWNVGDGSFDVGVPIPIGQSPYSMLAADFDGNGYPELVTANASDGSLTLLVNGGNRTFHEPRQLPAGSQPRFAMAGDLDGDGSVDLVSASRTSQDITVLLNEVALFSSDYLDRICTERDFHNVSIPSTAGVLADRVGKYILPASDDPDLLPTLFQNASRFAFHEKFLREISPDRFSGLTRDEYDQLIGRRDIREYFVGALNRRLVDGHIRYTFTAVADTAFDPREILRLDEIEWVYGRLGESFALQPLEYHPDTLRARQEAERWLEQEPPPSFPIFFDDGQVEIDYEAYTSGTGYGRVRLLTLEEFNVASHEGSLTFQDIVVIDQAPRDIEGVVGGVITAERQGQLSHVALRTAQRGTPNASIGDAMEVFAPHAGMLVRLDVFRTEYCVKPASPEEAEAFWSSSRPSLSTPPALEPDYQELDHLVDIDVERTPVARHGGKASRFAAMQRVLLEDEQYHQYLEEGFSIPVHAYLEFMETNTVEPGGEELSYREYLFGVMNSEEFRSDSSFRIGFLESFRDRARDEGVVDPALVTRLTERIEAVFGTPLRRVRFRSSSNVEDTLEFNGAGLYESTAACAADALDADDIGPSLCGFQDRERTIERALKKVWTSLWTFRAHEERWFYQIPQDQVAMGILVTRSFPEELANGVALTGDPGNSGDKRYFVTAQLGEASVVSPEPGVSVERDLLEVDNGEVVRIIRSRASSLAPAGEFVLSEEKLRELGALMWHVEQTMPVDTAGHDPQDVLLDFEFKIEPNGDLAVKQVRPFLIPTARQNAPTFELEIPPGSTVCGVFSTTDPGRTLQEEYETMSTLRLRAATVSLPTKASSFEAELFEELRFGPDRHVAVAEGPGEFTVKVTSEGGSSTRYTFDYRQSFTLESGDSLNVELFGLTIRSGCDLPEETTLFLDEEYITFELTMLGIMDGKTVVTYSSCDYDLLPLWDLDVELEGGSFLHLEERFEPAEDIGRTGPASLVRAEVLLEGERQVVDDYWRLVYAARRHNRNAGYWVVLDPPLELASARAAVHVVEYVAEEPFDETRAAVNYLGENFEVLQSVQALEHSREKQVETRFRRGDVNADGVLNIADVDRLLGYLFGGRSTGSAPLFCRDAADANDDGRLNIGDAVSILRHLFFAGGALLAPALRCGLDVTPDDLLCQTATRNCE